MEQNIIQIGNSTGVIIPKSLLEEVGLRSGSQVVIEKDFTGKSLRIIKKGTANLSSVTPEFIETLAKIDKEYNIALKKLAEG
ncbi:hypothetical protein HYT02_01100 [Candidatus Gottesmanbacteria bacterium]|nr:hypothetical protein [Candidatus Gottesmanbacteria bacterium]